MNASRMVIYITIMAGITYLMRMIPLTVFRKKIENKFICSFLYYVPYSVLAAMTFPAVLTSTASIYSAIIGAAAAIILSFFGKNLLTVALCSCAVVFICEFAMTHFAII